MKTARHFDILTVGSATRDIFVESTHFERVISRTAPDGYDTCLPLGSKINVDMMDFQTGGGATNAAVTFSRFGFKTAAAVRVGRDASGFDVINELKNAKIDTTATQIDAKRPTAHSIVIISGHGSRAILTERGASQALNISEIPFSKLSPKWIYLTSLGGDVNAVKRVFAAAKKYNMQVAWNPGNGELEHGLRELEGFIKQTDVFIVNREEGALLTNLAARFLDKIFLKLGAFPRLALVLTDGAHGAYAHARGITWHADPLKGKRINTTGAGDAFGSGFTASIIKDGDLEKALRVGSVNAFGVVTHMGAKRGILKHAPRPRELMLVKVRCLGAV